MTRGTYVNCNYNVHKCQRCENDNKSPVTKFSRIADSKNDATYGDAPSTPAMLFCISSRRIRMAIAKAEVVNIIFTTLKSCMILSAYS